MKILDEYEAKTKNKLKSNKNSDYCKLKKEYDKFNKFQL